MPEPQEHVNAGEAEYLLEEEFVKELVKLEPAWKTTSGWLLEFLRRLDECGDLRPRLRFRMPPEYAHWEAQDGGRDPLLELTDAQQEHFAEVHEALTSRRRWSTDPALQHPLEEDSVVSAYRENGDAAPGRWDDHRVIVGPGPTPESAPYYGYHLRAAYTPWQLVRAWTLLERYTFRALLDPRRAEDVDRFGPGWADGFSELVHVRARGDGRAARVAELIAADGWLSALYRVREIVNWARGRSNDPQLYRWQAGGAMTSQERWDVERARVVAQCRQLMAPWQEPSALGTEDDASDGDRGHERSAEGGLLPRRFVRRVRRMLELWRWATEHDHAKLTELVKRDLYTASEWAVFALGMDFAAIDRGVGPLVDHRHTTLAQVMQPNRYRARREMALQLEHRIEQLNATTQHVRFEREDVARFLDYLDANELWAWPLELSRWMRSRQHASDTRRDEDFLHLRSAALLLEPILGALAAKFGTDDDRAKMGKGTTMEPLKVFLAGRRDWRALVWQLVNEHYELTTTRAAGTPPAGTGSATAIAAVSLDPSLLLIDRIDRIAALDLPAAVGGAARQILIVTAVRNFGAHRFTRDVDLTEGYGGRIAWATIFTAMFYWKVASTLG